MVREYLKNPPNNKVNKYPLGKKDSTTAKSKWKNKKPLIKEESKES
jgi:hypothetical protein